MSTVWGYVRLSREELQDTRHTMEEKFILRSEICARLAAERGLALPTDQIFCERESGGTLKDRPLFRRLLEYCENGKCETLVTPYQDRVSRGEKRDEAAIEDTFVENGITLVTTEGVTNFGAMDYDPLPYEIRSLIARQERRNYIKKRRETNRSRLMQNKRSQGSPPYGYEADGTGYAIVGNEYPIVEEVFSRFLCGEGLWPIASDLNARGIPSPGGKAWKSITIRSILRNPFYAGRISQRSRNVRGKNVKLSTDEYVICPTDGGWSKAVTFEQWQSIQITLDSRKLSHPHLQSGLLTGILQCSHHRGMYCATARCYICPCHSDLDTHPGRTVFRPKMDDYAAVVCESVFDNLPIETLSWEPQDRTQTQREYSRVLSDLEKAQERVSRFMVDRAALIDLFGEELYRQQAGEARQNYDRIKRDSERLASILATPDLSELGPILSLVRENGGFMRFWNAATFEEKRATVTAIIKRIDLLPIPEGKTFLPGATVTLHDWVPAGTPIPELKARTPRLNRVI